MSRPSTFSQQALRRVAERLGPESGLLDGLSRLPSTTSSVSLSTSHSISKVAKPASSVFMQ